MDNFLLFSPVVFLPGNFYSALTVNWQFGIWTTLMYFFIFSSEALQERIIKIILQTKF